MGMTASQARYLALTARKTNTEYEGQQINQARTALANESANLFNRLLDLEVPVAPKTTDYTELQYSYTDGENESVLESWEQLSTSDPNYNYIVNHYYYANVYTGSQKQMQNPQVTTRADLQKEEIYSRNPMPRVEYETGANGEITTIKIVTSDGVKEISNPYVQVSSLNKDTKLENSLQDLRTAREKAGQAGVLEDKDVYGWQDATGTWHFLLKEDIGNEVDYKMNYLPSHIGNCELKELPYLTQDDGVKDEVAELAQILKDFPDSNMAKYLSFDIDGKLEYNGEGIYKFQLNGKDYYTNKTDLYNSMQTFDEYGKPIENQESLPYYNAVYLKTKIEETNHALIETDESGRFRSVKFDDDNLVYTLNTETVTDDAAYQDAMNEYNYEVQQYEKIIADINARTSIIQKEDRTLELRLKQLETEQNALKTEMDAVKKVISDSVEKIYKTFSD